MIELRTTSNVAIKVYDHTPIRDRLAELGLASEEISNLNRFAYASLPEGSHGAFLVLAEDVIDLTPGKSPISLYIYGQVATFSHVNLIVSSVRYIERDPLDPINSDPINQNSKRFAIVEVSDRWFAHDSIIRQDYNKTSFLLPTSGSEYSSYPDPALTWTQVIADILTNYKAGAVSAAYSLSGFPSVTPQNVLSSGSSVKEMLQYIADSHFLVAYYSRSVAAAGQIVITDAVQTLGNLSVVNQVVYSSYGHTPLAKTLNVVFSIQGHQYSRMRGAILADYYNDDDFDTEWLNKEGNLTPSNDFLGANSRFQSDYTDYDHYYPFHHSGVYDATDADSTTIFNKLAINLALRTKREGVIGYKDVVLVEPSMQAQKIEYIYSDQGISTFLHSSPPRKIEIDPHQNHLTRGFEYAPPVLYGTVPSPSGSNILGGYAPDSDAELELPAEGDLLSNLIIDIYNQSTQQMFEGDTVAVYYSIQKKKYIFLDLCERLWQFLLLTPWFGGLAIAIRRTPDGVSTGKRVLVRDPLGIFDYLTQGDVGWMIYTVNDAFYAIQADCDSNPSTPGTVGACIVSDSCIEGVTASDCALVGGIYQGDGSTCP